MDELSKEQRALQILIHKAWEDEDFKEELKSNPVRVLEDVIGQSIKLPDGKTIKVTDQTDTSIIHITIPPKLNMEDMELNEEQLEIVAGGGVLKDPVLTSPPDSLSGLW